MTQEVAEGHQLLVLETLKTGFCQTGTGGTRWQGQGPREAVKAAGSSKPAPPRPLPRGSRGQRMGVLAGSSPQHPTQRTEGWIQDGPGRSEGKGWSCYHWFLGCMEDLWTCPWWLPPVTSLSPGGPLLK